MTTQINQLAVLRTATSRWHAGVITHIVSGDQVDLLVLGDGSDWEDSVPAAFYARPMAGINKGTGIGEWQPANVPDEVSEAIASAVSGGLTGYADEAYVDSACAAIAAAATSALAAAVATVAASYQVVAVAGSSVTLAIGTARRPSTTRPTDVRLRSTGTRGRRLGHLRNYAGGSDNRLHSTCACGVSRLPLPREGHARRAHHRGRPRADDQRDAADRLQGRLVLPHAAR